LAVELEEGSIMTNIMKVMDNFRGKKVAVIGDIILDKYIFGEVDRISPEAPVPVVKVTDEKYIPGGAANVASNLVALGAEVYLLGITGEDENRDILFGAADLLGIDTTGILTDEKKKTTKKTRIISLNQQLLRIDFEDTAYIESHLENAFISKLISINDLDALIVSDYAKGTITKKLMEKLKKFCKDSRILLVVDPKPKHKDWYKAVDLLTPNKNEAELMSGIQIEQDEDFHQSGLKLTDKFKAGIIITAGAKGMYVVDGENVVRIATAAKEVYDVSGAGDTVVAVLTLALTSGADMVTAAEMANHAAGIKVGKLGTAVVSWQELFADVLKLKHKE